MVPGLSPLCYKKTQRTHLLARPMSCSRWRIPIHSGPFLETNCPHPYFPNPPLTPTHLLGPVLYYNDDVNNFSLLDLEH
jgi:hypothetical protein